MPVNLSAKKRLVSRMTGVGIKRIKFDVDHLDDVADAITRQQIRSLITANTIRIKQIVGTSRGRAQAKKNQKKKRGMTQGAKKIRSLRRRLKIAKDRKEITNKNFWEIYTKIRGNTVRNIAHLRTLIEEIKTKGKD